MNMVKAPVIAVLAVLLTACAQATAERNSRNSDVPAGVSAAFAGMLELSAVEFRETGEQRGFGTSEDGVLIDIQTRGLDDDHRDALSIDGLAIHGFYPQYERVSATAVRGSVIRRVAELPFVRNVAPEFGSTSGSTGSGATY